MWLRKGLFAAIAISAGIDCGNSMAHDFDVIAERPKSCSVSGRHWTPQEHWVWQQVCANRLADLASQYKGGADPSQASTWPAGRRLRAAFFYEIFTDPDLTSRIGPSGLQISGALIADNLNLSQLHIERSVYLEHSALASIDLSNATLDHEFSLNGSTVSGNVNLFTLQLGQHLYLEHATLESVDLGYANVSGSIFASYLTILKNITLSSSNIRGEVRIDNFLSQPISKLKNTYVVNMISTEIGSALYFNNSDVGGVDLSSVQIGRFLDVSDAKINDLVLSEAHIAQYFSGVRLHSNKINFIDANIGTFIDFSNSNIKEDLNMDSIDIGSHLFFKSWII
jgi:uncharacterized protein YjbI with pentapeptide repeats